MFEKSALYALSKIQDKLCVYKINVDKDTLSKIKNNFERGVSSFHSMEVHNFSPSYKLDQDECSKMENYVISDIICDAVRNSVLHEITGDQFEEKQIKALFMGERSETEHEELFTIVFKRFYFSNCLSRNGLNIWLNKKTYNAISSNIISIPDSNHLLFENGTLYFSSYKIANEILYLTDRYRSATNSDIDNFIKNISFDNKINFYDFATTKLRKLIAQINDSRILEEFSKEQLSLEAKEQNVPLTYDNDKIKLNLENKNETMLVLDFLAENTFLSTFKKERTRTNSKEKV